MHSYSKFVWYTYVYVGTKNYSSDLFQPKNVDERNLLYDRIADSFVGLFASIHKDVKDKFLSVWNKVS